MQVKIKSSPFMRIVMTVAIYALAWRFLSNENITDFIIALSKDLQQSFSFSEDVRLVLLSFMTLFIYAVTLIVGALIVLKLPYKFVSVDENGLHIYRGKRLVKSYGFDNCDVGYTIAQNAALGNEFEFGALSMMFSIQVRTSNNHVNVINLSNFKNSDAINLISTLIAQNNIAYAKKFASIAEMKSLMHFPFNYITYTQPNNAVITQTVPPIPPVFQAFLFIPIK
ncbi:MAG: hypothetical protein LBS74_03540 [Oscillospiraceae bacterium]|jgi:hypothetical protein|nr:hypothetical protein [Oscillospiraceae bacterium]